MLRPYSYLISIHQDIIDRKFNKDKQHLELPFSFFTRSIIEKLASNDGKVHGQLTLTFTGFIVHVIAVHGVSYSTGIRCAKSNKRTLPHSESSQETSEIRTTYL